MQFAVMKKVFAIGIGAAAGFCALTFALHLLNRPSDISVFGGYVIVLALLGSALELIRRYRRRKAVRRNTA